MVAEGKFYQCLIGGDVLVGKPGILGPATITMPCPSASGSIQWKQEKLGCIAHASFLPPATTVNPTDALPPPPPPSTEIPTTTLEAEGVTMDKATMGKLADLAAERDAQH